MNVFISQYCVIYLNILYLSSLIETLKYNLKSISFLTLRVISSILKDQINFSK